MKHSLIRVFLLFFTINIAISQTNIHPQSSGYIWPDDPLVKEKLEKWRDQKFGMIIHWGLYAVPGIVESWTLCSESWIERDSTIAYEDYKKWYWGLQKDFNPIKFNPEQWAQAAKDAGMKYLVFTTKHHDGFCMFNTKQTDFSIAKGPFANNPKADVAKYVFEAFRNKGLMIGAYFSKPDWHSEYYWWPKYATPDRNNNYDIRKYPWRWNKFREYTYSQINELMHGYGNIDILWLDGGWVRPLETVNDEVRAWGAAIPEWGQDIDVPRIAAMARNAQPGILLVDRTVKGAYENYQTPEQHIPENALDYPWESCITLGNNWGFVPGEQMKSSKKVIELLIEVVAKGGSLLLGVGPKPDGTMDSIQIQRLKEIGTWLKTNGEAIYNTRVVKNFHDGQVFFTRNKDKNIYYALFRCPENMQYPASIEWTGNFPLNGSQVKLLLNGVALKWEKTNGKTVVTIPPSILKKYTNYPAFALSFIPEKADTTD
jgi:alpha-L-fucosidase